MLDFLSAVCFGVSVFFALSSIRVSIEAGAMLGKDAAYPGRARLAEACAALSGGFLIAALV